jgi:hypothetical protein
LKMTPLPPTLSHLTQCQRQTYSFASFSEQELTRWKSRF